jgi:antitoxin VapB
MAIHVRDPKTDSMVRELARKKGCGITEAIQLAVAEELKRERERTPLRERIRALQDEVARYPETGLKADKAFFDELSGDED